MYYDDDTDTARGYVYNYPDLPYPGYVEEAGGVTGLRGTGGSQGSITQSLDLWGTNNPPGTSATYLFNGNITTGQWHGSSPTNEIEYVQFQFPTAKTITRYRGWYKGHATGANTWQDFPHGFTLQMLYFQ